MLQPILLWQQEQVVENQNFLNIHMIIDLQIRFLENCILLELVNTHYNLKFYFKILSKTCFTAAAHFDEREHIFYMQNLADVPKPNSPQMALMKTITKLWTNFAKYK